LIGPFGVGDFRKSVSLFPQYGVFGRLSILTFRDGLDNSRDIDLANALIWVGIRSFAAFHVPGSVREVAGASSHGGDPALMVLVN
jgi:hypothetical protein